MVRNGYAVIDAQRHRSIWLSIRLLRQTVPRHFQYYSLMQPYLMGTAKVTKPAQPLDKDPANLNNKIATVPRLVFFSVCCILGGLLIFVQFGVNGFLENLLRIFYVFSQESSSKLPTGKS